MRLVQHIDQANASLVETIDLQRMLRSVVVSFAVDVHRHGLRWRCIATTLAVYRNKYELNSAVYCTNGDDDAKRTALATVGRAVPLPASPPSLPDVNGQLTLMEPWLLNDNGHFQLGTLSSRQGSP